MTNHLLAAHRILRAGVLWLGLFAAGAASTVPRALSSAALSAEILSAYGPPCSLIRGMEMFRAGPGVILRPGDLIATEPGTLLVLAFKSGSTVAAVVAVGPSSRLYWMDRPDRVALAVRGGWVKVDALTAEEHLAVQAEGPYLRAAGNVGTFVLHVGDHADEVFHESGSMQLWSRDADGVGTGASSMPNQFARRAGAEPLVARIGPDAVFVDAMPAAFLDPLPRDLATRPLRGAEPQKVRRVGYEDVAEWLSAPRDWRRGLAKRFGLRLKGTALSH